MQSSLLRRRRVPQALIFSLSLGAFVACSDDNDVTAPPVGGALQAADFQRLLVADAEQSSARVVGVADGATLQTYTLSGPASSVYASGGGRIGIIQQRTTNRVNFVDGGVWADGLTGNRRTPVQIGFELNEGLPTHENVNANWISVFFDGTGRGVWINENDLTSGTPKATYEVATGTAHHGGSATTVLGGVSYLVTSTTNTAGAATGIEVRNPARQVVASMSDCPGLHGNGASTTGAVFGCNDGLALVRQGTGGAVVAQKITTSGDMAGLALRNAYSAVGASFVLGQFAAFTGQPTQRVLATIDPATATLGRLPALPAGVTDHWRAIEPVRGDIVLLGTNGSLYVYAASTRQLRLTVNNVVPALPATGALTHQVSVAEGVAAVANPTVAEVVIVDLTNGSIRRRIAVAGKPSRVALLGARREGTFIEAR